MRIRLNLMPERVLHEREARGRRRTLVGIPLAGVALVVVLYGLLSLQESQANMRAREAEQFLAPLRPASAKLLEMQQEAETLERQREDLTVALRQRRQWTLLLVEVGRVIPQDSWLTTMTLDASTMTLTGFTFRLRSVASFTQSLAGVPDVTSVHLQSLQEIVSGGQRVTQYIIIARLRATP